LVGDVVDDSNSSKAKISHCGGVLSTVRVVEAVEVASTFTSSLVPALKRKARMKTATPVTAVKTVIFPVVLMNLGSESTLNDIIHNYY
jgi:hypothetical protein